MKKFLKYILAFLIAGLLLPFVFIFLIIAIGFIVSIGSGKDTQIKENSVLVLDFKSKIIEHENEEQISIFNLEDEEPIRYQDVIHAIKTAKNDPNIKGISIENDQISAGQGQLEHIRESLEDFKKSGKFIYTYGNNVSQSSYFLGSVADQYFLNPVGAIELKGLSSEITFLKEFTEKYGINMNIIRHGKFKAAVEPFMRNEISPENRKQMTSLLNDIWDGISSKIAQSRKISQSDFQTITNELYGIIPELSLQHKLVDGLMQKSEYGDFLKKKLNLNQDTELVSISISDYISQLPENEYSGNKIAVLYASGTIYNGDELDNIYSEAYIHHIKELADDDNIKAVVLRVNSPGGSANASDEILFELQQLKKKKPLIISFGDYAASGGYYIAMAGDKIFAQNSTITGSIGVFGMIPDAKNLANRNGIYSDVVSTNTNSNMISPISGVSNGTLAILQQSVEKTYQRFIHFVAKNRKKSIEEIDKIGEGRVWSGKTAKEIGLVDEIGTLDDAILYASKSAKINDFQVETYPAKVDKFKRIFGNLNKNKITTNWIKSELSKTHFQLFQIFSNPNNKKQIQMAMPFVISIK